MLPKDKTIGRTFFILVITQSLWARKECKCCYCLTMAKLVYSFCSSCQGQAIEYVMRRCMSTKILTNEGLCWCLENSKEVVWSGRTSVVEKTKHWAWKTGWISSTVKEKYAPAVFVYQSIHHKGFTLINREAVRMWVAFSTSTSELELPEQEFLSWSIGLYQKASLQEQEL